MSRLSVVAWEMDLENLAEVGAEWGLTTKMWQGNFQPESHSGGCRGRQSLQTGKRCKNSEGEGGQCLKYVGIEPSTGEEKSSGEPGQVE